MWSSVVPLCIFFCHSILSFKKIGLKGPFYCLLHLLHNIVRMGDFLCWLTWLNMNLAYWAIHVTSVQHRQSILYWTCNLTPHYLLAFFFVRKDTVALQLLLQEFAFYSSTVAPITCCRVRRYDVSKWSLYPCRTSQGHWYAGNTPGYLWDMPSGVSINQSKPNQTDPIRKFRSIEVGFVDLFSPLTFGEGILLPSLCPICPCFLGFNIQ